MVALPMTTAMPPPPSSWKIFARTRNLHSTQHAACVTSHKFKGYSVGEHRVESAAASVHHAALLNPCLWKAQ
jgi:hypothetical protein